MGCSAWSNLECPPGGSDILNWVLQGEWEFTDTEGRQGRFVGSGVVKVCGALRSCSVGWEGRGLSEAGKEMGPDGSGCECQAKEFGLKTYVGHREPLGGSSNIGGVFAF